MRYTLFGVATMVLALALTGCAQKPIHMATSFDSAQAQKLMAPGNNTLRGSAVIRQSGGGTVTCAGYNVQLVPATAYARDRIRAIYKSENGGFLDVNSGFGGFDSTDSEYTRLTSSTTCDAQGFFTFENISDGEFYVTTTIAWKVPVNAYVTASAGGALAKKVALSGGKTTNIVLAP